MTNISEEKPPVSWIVATLGFAGAQFVVLPFLAFLALASHGKLFEAPGAYVVAALLLIGGVAVLRARPGLFVAQLCLSALLSGMAILAFALKPDQLNAMALMLIAVSLTIALLIEDAWIQRILGYLAGSASLCLTSISLSTEPLFLDAWNLFPRPINAILLAIVWSAWQGQPRFWNGALAAHLDACLAGAGIAVILALAYGEWSTFSFLGTQLGRWAASPSASPFADAMPLFHLNAFSMLQILLIAAAFVWLVWRQRLADPAQRHTLLLLGLVFALLALFAPFSWNNGALAVITAGALVGGSRRMLLLAGLVLLVKLSAFYYALRWPLVDKAALLAASGAALGIALWLARRLANRRSASVDTQAVNVGLDRPTSILSALLLGALALGVVHWDVRGKESVIATGQKIFIPLAPRDPRSLMQGDYMALNFIFPREISDRFPETRREQRVVAHLDARGVATVKRWAIAPEALGDDEILLPLKWMKNNWTLVTDAFYFPEGQGEPLERARFGEFRVLPDGRALLVGLTDEHLRALHPAFPAPGTP